MTGIAQESGVSTVLVVSPAPLRSGGLGGAAAEFSDGIEALGHRTSFVGPQTLNPLARGLSSRPFRRAFGMAPYRRCTARAVRRAVPPSGWDLSYSMPGSVPIEQGRGARVIYQATRFPAIEWEALRRAERATGGRGDLTAPERRRREFEIAHADLIHVTSEAVRDEFLEAGVSPERLVYARHGVDLDRFAPGKKSDTLTIAFVGPLSLRKGVDVVAELASRLDGEAVVEAVGGPTCPWSRRISQGARFVPRDSVAEMLSSAHVLVLPSRSDGFAFVVLEALACGAVPLVTPEVGSAEIVRKLDARLVIPHAEFADTAAELLPALDLADLSVRARDLARRFDRKRSSRAVAAAVLDRVERL